jgi:outer membrane protein assembly factor BamB
MKDSAIRHLATSRSGKVVAAARFESTVSIWNLETQTKQSEFETILDFGGTRLAIDAEGKRCVAGAYHIHGIACYRADTGAVLWQRKDLKKVQRIAILPSQSEIACGFEGGLLQILSMRNGKTLQKVRGCRQLHVSPFEPVQLADKAQLTLETLDGSLIRRFGRESFATLSVVFGHGAVAVSEAAGPTRCFETISGELLWRYAAPKGRHSLNLGYNVEQRRFLGLEWPFQRGDTMTLLVFTPDGNVETRFPLGASILQEFCVDGTRLLSSSGWLLDTATGKVAAHLDFPMMDYPDK